VPSSLADERGEGGGPLAAATREHPENAMWKLSLPFVALVFSSMPSLAQNEVCPAGLWEDHLHRWEYTTKHANVGVGDQLYWDRDSDNALDTDEPFGWVLMDYGTGAGNGIVLAFEDALQGRGWFDSGAPLENVAAPAETVTTSGVPIGTRVFACESASGPGYTMASKVVISPARSTSSDELDLKQPLEIAWFYWTDNPLLDYSAGSISFPGGRIALDAGVYKLTNTARLNLRGAAVGALNKSIPIAVDIDGGGASVYLNPATPSDVEIVNASGTTDLSGVTCNEAAFGTTRTIIDPASLDDTTTGGTVAKTVSGVTKADETDAPQCDTGANLGLCDWGTDTLKITTSTSHGFSAGLPSRQGDLVTWSGSGDNQCDGNYLVKGVKDTDEFFITVADDTTCTSTSGTFRLAALTAECNGHSWAPGWVGINIGGKNDTSVSAGYIDGLRIHDLKFRFFTSPDPDLTRYVAIRGDTWYGSGNTGGFLDLTIERVYCNASAGQGADRGHICVDLGKGDSDLSGADSFGKKVVLTDIVTDNFGTSHSYTVRNSHVSDVEIRAYTTHGGGVYIGNLGGTKIGPISLTGSLEGINDGPALTIIGAFVNLRDIDIGGDVNSGSGGPDRGLTAILGSSGHEARVTATGVNWTPTGGNNEHRNECAVFVNDVWMEQHGGGLSLVDRSEESDPARAHWCGTSGSTIRKLAIYGLRVQAAESTDPSDSDYYKEYLGAPTYAGLVCPNCATAAVQPTGGVSALGYTDIATPLATGGCLNNGWHASISSIGLLANCNTMPHAEYQTSNLMMPAFGLGGTPRPWFHALTCWYPSAEGLAVPTGWASGDSLTLEAQINNYSQVEVVKTLTLEPFVDWSGTPVAIKKINAAPVTVTGERLAFQVDVTAGNNLDGNEVIRIGCEPVYSWLVPF